MRNLKLFLKSAVAFFFLFFLHGFSIGNGQQGISYNLRLLATHSAKPTINKNLKDEKPPEITEHYPSGC